MDVLGGTGQVELNLFRTQKDQERSVRALASGLRVSSASDDPSGLAIAENLQTKVSGLQQGVQNVQNAGNLLNVADATLANVQTILSRIHSLIVQAASDYNSNEQLQAIQTEIESLLKEVNKIASDANFNGIKLFDGSHATLSSTYSNAPFVEQVHAFDQNTGPNVSNATGSGTPGPLIVTGPNSYGGSGAGGFVSGLIEFQITGYSTNPVDPNLGPLGAPGVYVKITQYSTDPNFAGKNGAQEQISTNAFFTNAGVDQGGSAFNLGNANNSLNMLVFDLANLTPQDVGTAIAFETFDAAPTPTGNPLQINSSGAEGGVVQISLPSVTTSALGINSISVLSPQLVDWQNNPAGTADNAAAAADAEARVQNALDAISHARATVGAQSVALQQDASDASLQIVNQIASESAIRDVNIGSETTQFTRDQIIAQIGVSVLAQMQTDASLVVQLVSGQSAKSSSSSSSNAA